MFNSTLAAERVQLAEEIWESIAAEPELLQITEAQRAELDRRLAAASTDAAASTQWPEVREKLDRSR